jgi:hypothetical protein
MDTSKDGESSEPVSTRQVIKFWRSVIKLIGIILELQCGSSAIWGNKTENISIKLILSL